VARELLLSIEQEAQSGNGHKSEKLEEIKGHLQHQT
jgi:hypothetical protein